MTFMGWLTFVVIGTSFVYGLGKLWDIWTAGDPEEWRQQYADAMAREAEYIRAQPFADMRYSDRYKKRPL